MKSCVKLCLAVLGILWTGNVWAANSVVVQSKTVAPGETGVTIGASVTNDIAVGTFVLPLELREITPGSFTTSNFAFDVQGRVLSSGLNDLPIKEFYANPDAVNSCSGPVSQTWSGGTATPIGFFTSPDAVIWAGTRLFNPLLQPGFDMIPSFLFTFDVTSTPGQFEIDTCCRVTSNHLMFADEWHMPIPVSFTKGTVTIFAPVCNDRPADVNCDGVVNVLDVVTVVNSAFRSVPEPGQCCATGP